MADSPTLNTDGPTGVLIKVDGKATADTLMIASVKIHKHIGRIPEAILILETGSVATNEFDDVDDESFDLGKDIEISAYYGAETPGLLFKGVIFGKRMRIRGASPPQMILTCRDKAAKLNVVKKTAQFTEQKDSDAMNMIIADAGLDADITATKLDAQNQLQYNTTDWDFLRLLADRNGYVLVTDDAKITVNAPDTGSAVLLTLTLGVDILAFDAAAETHGLIGAASGYAWDDGTQEVVTNEGDDPPALDWGNLSDKELSDVIGTQEHSFATPDLRLAADIGVLTSARRLRSSLSALQGRCSFVGNAKPLPNTMIELKGVGARFGGNAYVAGVSHSIEGGEWTTEVTMGLPNIWRTDSSDVGGADAAGLTAPVHGLQIGKVTKIVEDPETRQRVQVSLPMFGTAETLVWARFAAPYSTAGAGIQFMPELDDEVVVAFLGADPNAPVILGSLHNGTHAQYYDPDAPNTFKGIVSRSLMKIEFEDEKKVLTVQTPGGHSMVLDDDEKTITITDSSGNTMKMAEAGITLDSPGDISMTATGKIDIKATGDASVAGMNVDVTADTKLTASGSAGAELSSSGQTVVKGSIVMIN